MARIAVIGWGSLLWDLDDLAPKVRGEWNVARGPMLPFEFSRVSDKRKKALTVVINYDHGVECSTSYIESTRGDIGLAVEDLAARERTTPEFIGHCTVHNDGPSGGHADAIGRFKGWLADAGFEGAVWTNLPCNFEERIQTRFSVSRALDYLQALEGESRIEARRYIENAPRNVVTPLRKALRGEPWWQAIDY